ncbi:T9SS type A sorting domain-containing protein, partial [bacterium BMS3Abin03]|nr:T9SS type A sorting domain-containing protein [bacterium BMS3Abin03]
NGGSGTNDGDVHREASDSITTTAYVSFLVELSSALSGDYFFHLGAKNMGFNYRLRIYAKDTTAGGWKIGISKSSGGQLYCDTVLAYNQTYLVIAKYTINTVSATDDEVQLYVYDNGIPLTEPGNPLISFGPVGAGATGDIDDIGTVAIRQGTNTPTGMMDGIILSSTWPTAPPLLTIAEAIEDLNSDYVPDREGDTVMVSGVITSPNYQTSHNSFYLQDATAGVNVFMYGPPVFTWALGDSLTVIGTVAQYNGMTEINPLDSTYWQYHSSGNTVPNPIVLTLVQYTANPEMYEGSLVGFVGLSLVGGTWPATPSGSGTNLELSDGVDTVVFRIDFDTDIGGQTEPSWPVDVIGIGSQYDNSAPYDGGYQIFPRYYATDFLPAGTIPVELTSFTAKVSGNVVNLSWSTATETNNLGFEIQRKTSDQFITVGFVDGHGTSTEIHNYSYTDSKVESGKYYYRLKQIDLDGTYEYSKVVEAEVLKPVKFALDQNYPNPFNPTTMINVNLATDSRVKLVVFDILGQEVATLLNGNLTAGLHQIEFNASNLNSGVYFYRVDAAGVDGTNFSSVKKMILTK